MTLPVIEPLEAPQLVASVQKRKTWQAVSYSRFSLRGREPECDGCQHAHHCPNLIKRVRNRRGKLKFDPMECSIIARQIQDIRDYCRHSHIKLEGEYCDMALSGGDDWETRPGMLDAQQAVPKGGLFVVRSYDRLFRDVRKAAIFAAMLDKKKVQIRATTQEVASLDDPTSELIRNIFLSFAQYQRQITKAQTRMKMRQYQANGRRMSKEPPFGMMVDPADPSQIVKNYQEVAVIGEIMRMHGMNYKVSRICRELNDRNQPARGKKGWHHPLVKRIIQRETGEI